MQGLRFSRLVLDSGVALLGFSIMVSWLADSPAICHLAYLVLSTTRWEKWECHLPTMIEHPILLLNLGVVTRKSLPTRSKDLEEMEAGAFLRKIFLITSSSLLLPSENIWNTFIICY